ncbi:MAG: hypothetical protein R2857_09070 [Vampirovibrionales bacterium]
MLEPKTQDALAELVSLGHHIGLHFDCALTSNALNTLADLEAPLTREHTLLSLLVNTPIRVVSFHNPDVGDVMNRFEQDYPGRAHQHLQRTASRKATPIVPTPTATGAMPTCLRWWRAAKGNPDHKPLHLLTHPGWWVPDGRRPIPGNALNAAYRAGPATPPTTMTG